MQDRYSKFTGAHWNYIPTRKYIDRIKKNRDNRSPAIYSSSFIKS